MSLIPKIGRLGALLKASKIGKNQVKTYATSYHYPDWKPGPYPKTKEEREAAAKKYGMLPEEYEPYPDDGSGFGDYPMLQPQSDLTKNLYLTWHQQGLIVRNHNEPIPMEFLMYTSEKFNTDWEKNYTVYQGLVMAIIGLFAGGGLMALLDSIKQYSTRAPKQWPYKGEIHYTFDLLD